MNIYIENRSWLSGCQFNENTIELIKDSNYLNSITEKLPFLNKENVIFRNDPILIYSHLNAFEIEIKKESLKALYDSVIYYYKKDDDDPEALEKIQSLHIDFLDYKILIFDNGFINITSKFLYDDLNDLEKIDYVGSGVILINESICEMIVPLIDVLIENKIISKNEFYYFGVPNSVTNEIHKCSSYLVTQHFLTDDDSIFKNLTKDISQERHFIYDKKYVAVAKGNYLLIWNYKNSDFGDLDFLSVDFISNCETVLYSVSTNSSRKLLRLHNMKNVSNAKETRLIINFLNETLLSLYYLYYYMNLDDRNYIKIMSELIDRDSLYKLFKDTENTLKYSAESIEVEKNQKSALSMQIILGIFTGITLFSVLNDVFSILNLNCFLTPSYILIKITFLLIISSIIYYMINYLKKSSK